MSFRVTSRTQTRTTARLSYEGDAYRYGEMLIFPGLEVNTAEGPHVLVIGGREKPSSNGRSSAEPA